MREKVVRELYKTLCLANGIKPVPLYYARKQCEGFFAYDYVKGFIYYGTDIDLLHYAHAAYVLGHEVAHHVLHRNTCLMMATLISTQDEFEEYFSPFSKQMETEADIFGYHFARKFFSKKDILDGIRFWIGDGWGEDAENEHPSWHERLAVMEQLQ
jgi:Zn-dependent peptidase ImmA (M78 family)